jgi:hypothetical protein
MTLEPAMPIKNLVGYRLVVTAVLVACVAFWLATGPFLMPEPNPTGVQLESLLASLVIDVLGIAALVFGVVYGKRLAFELYNERTPQTNDSPPDTAIRAVQPDTEPT